jgi:cyclic pyranopterin phosphate synthase
LRAAGVRRVNVSLDTLDRARFARITRRDQLPQVLDIAAAREAGLAVKINVVALKGINQDEIPIIAWAHAQGQITLIEVMPLGEVEEDRFDHYLPLTAVRDLERRWTLESDRTAPAAPRYVRLAETGGRLGFITPLTDNFCEGCNRVRVTATGNCSPALGARAGGPARGAAIG